MIWVIASCIAFIATGLTLSPPISRKVGTLCYDRGGRRKKCHEIYVEDYANILFIYENVICDFNSNIYALVHIFIGIFNFRRHQIAA